MKANEFRIGNIVTVKGKEDILTGIAENDYISELHGHGIDNEDIKVITLTDDWLLRFDIYNLNAITVNSGDLWVDLKESMVGISGEDSCTSDSAFYAHCKYVHQLQNLYFALTGEELKTDKPNQ